VKLDLNHFWKENWFKSNLRAGKRWGRVIEGRVSTVWCEGRGGIGWDPEMTRFGMIKG